MPGHRALAGAGQADRPGAHVRTASGAIGELAQRQVPARVGLAGFVEIQVEQHHRPDHQARVDQQVGKAHLLVRVLGHLHDVVEQRLEFRIEHFLADTAVVEEDHGLHHLRLLLHPHGMTSGAAREEDPEAAPDGQARILCKESRE
ncbi:hypothetical protein D3C76_1117610 [compost metagenome]